MRTKSDAVEQPLVIQRPLTPAARRRRPTPAPAPAAPAVAGANDPRVAAATTRRAADRWGFLEFFIIAQLVFPALLYVPGSQAIRVPIRVAPFALGVLGLAVAIASRHARRVRLHVAIPLLSVILAYLTVMIAHPHTNTLLAGVGQVVLYLSVMAPVLWAPMLVRSRAQVQRVLIIILACNGINSLVAVLQVYDPDHFMPRELSKIVTDYLEAIPTYIGPDGRQMVRPTGLSDNPGAVCAPAAVAALLGMIFFVRPIWWLPRALSLLAAMVSVAAIFLSHVRTSILVMCGTCLVFATMLYLRGRRLRAFGFVGAGVGVLALALFSAQQLAGDSVLDRFLTLFEADPMMVYYQAGRGGQIEYMFRAQLSEYPLGAGLARWGMMRFYFGDEGNEKSPPIWAELQWPAWMLDGGLVVLVLYSVVLIRNTWNEGRACIQLKHSSMADYASMIFATNMGVIALVFGYTPFTTQIGIQYWFLAGLLHGVTQLPKRELI